MNDSAAIIAAALEDGPRTLRVLADTTELELEEVRDAVGELQAEGTVERVPGPGHARYALVAGERDCTPPAPELEDPALARARDVIYARVVNRDDELARLRCLALAHAIAHFDADGQSFVVEILRGLRDEIGGVSHG